MPIIYFCDGCGKELFRGMSRNMKETTAIWEIEQNCICTDCMLKEIHKVDTFCVYELVCSKTVFLCYHGRHCHVPPAW